MPRLRHIANLWTLMGHPTAEAEWPLNQKLAAIKAAGFDCVCWGPLDGLKEGCSQHGLTFVGGMASGDRAAFPEICSDLAAAGAVHVNVQLASDTTSADEALSLTLALMHDAEPYGLLPAIETHRGTATETPEKFYELANAYQRETGNLLPTSFDFSHFAVLKHLVPANFGERLLIHPALIQKAQQFHFRPFNGHHAQVAITNSDGSLTQEVLDWIPFARSVFECWLEGNRDSDREIFVCPELGPIEGGYALSTFPNSWEDAKRLRPVIDNLWREALG